MLLYFVTCVVAVTLDESYKFIKSVATPLAFFNLNPVLDII